MHARTRDGLVKAGLVAGTIAINLAAGIAILSAENEPTAPAAPPAAPRPVAASSPPPAPEAAPAKPAPKPFVIHRVLDILGVIRYGQWFWDEHGAPAQGTLVITVDLEARVLSAFRDGYEIGTAAVLLGAEDKPTPLGVFPITQKDADHHSNLYNNAPMPYMMRLTNDGVTIHGTTVENGYASHGCVGVPTPFAQKLFGVAHVGDIVIITRGKQVGVGDALVKG